MTLHLRYFHYLHTIIYVQRKVKSFWFFLCYKGCLDVQPWWILGFIKIVFLSILQNIYFILSYLYRRPGFTTLLKIGLHCGCLFVNFSEQQFYRTLVDDYSHIPSNLNITVWKVSVFRVILVRIFLHLDWIRRDTPYLSVFSSNAGK